MPVAPTFSGPGHTSVPRLFRSAAFAACILAAHGLSAVSPAETVRMSAAGDCRLPKNAWVVASGRGYNSWPMIQAVGGRLVCAYSRDNALPEDGHSISPGSRDSYMRFSCDGGRTWSDEIVVADDPRIGEVNEGIGLDEAGDAILWVRCWGVGRRHELYRSRDGKTVEKIASITPDPFPMQIMDPVRIEGLGLVSPWFAGEYRKTAKDNSWGLLTSADNGRTWTQRIIERGLSIGEWVTEPSLADLGNGRLLIVGRCEKGLGSQFQVTSFDGGKTWKKFRTNISDVLESTPSLVYDAGSGLVANYYYHRGARLLKRRVARAAFIFDHPDRWPDPEVLDEGFEPRAFDAGNVKATRLGEVDCCAWYTGTQSNSTVVVTVVPKPRTGVEKPLKVLAIGNSYTASLMKQMPAIAADMGVKLDIAVAVIGGCSLEKHVRLMDNPGLDAHSRPWACSYSYADGGRPNLPNKCWNCLRDAIAADCWDVVTIQQASHFSWKPETYRPWGDNLIGRIRVLAPDAEIAVQETWSDHPGCPRLEKWGITSSEMYERLHAAYADFAKPYGLRIIPSGTAVEKAREFGMVQKKVSDPHLNPAGEFLQGLVWAETLFGVDVTKGSYVPDGMDAALAKKLRDVAHETVSSRASSRASPCPVR